VQQYVRRNGVKVPKVGLGTYRMDESECGEATSTALEAGYRHVDTAMAYENESAVGRAIAQSDVDREEVFITTKVKGYPEYLNYEGFLEAADGCLDRLGMDYVDLLLVHWWRPDGDLEGVCRAMDELVDRGRVRNVGVSNFTVDELRRAQRLTEAPVFTNQVKYHPYFYDHQQDLLEYCREQDVLLTAYSPLAAGVAVDDSTLGNIGEKYGKSAPQVAIRWLLQQEGVITIAKSVTERYIYQNIDVFDFELSDTEMRRVAQTRGPIKYELFKEDGPVEQTRAVIGAYLPEPVRKRITATGAAAMDIVK